MSFRKKESLVRPTHAGGIVYRIKDDLAYYLLVNPKSRTDEWVLPKGHIEKSEQPEQTASREVLEEAGVVVRIICPLSAVTFKAKGEDLHVQFFLMEQIGEGAASEGRAIHWSPFEEARRMLTHTESKDLLELAERERLT